MEIMHGSMVFCAQPSVMNLIVDEMTIFESMFLQLAAAGC